MIIAKDKILCKFPRLCSLHQVFSKLVCKVGRKPLYNMKHRTLFYYIKEKSLANQANSTFQYAIFST